MLRLRAVALTVVSACAVTFMAGCGGVKEADVQALEARLEVLRTKGLPDDSTSLAKVHIYQAKEHLGKGNKAPAKVSYDSAVVNLERAEKFYNEQVATLGPTIDAAKAKAMETKAELTGYQARKVDSVMNVVDSLRKLDWLLKSNNVAQEFIAHLPVLKEDEAKAARLRRLVPGEWVTENRTKSVEHKEVNALERKVFTFYRDGKVYLVESKKGQSGPFFKEDWEFRSWGTYDYKGDTIMLSINRFAAVRQNFTKGILNQETMKITWKDEPAPTYDSTITDGSQDRFVTYDDLKEDFSQRKRF